MTPIVHIVIMISVAGGCAPSTSRSKTDESGYRGPQAAAGWVRSNALFCEDADTYVRAKEAAGRA